MIKKRFGKEGGHAVMTFSERVVAIALRIPKGKVLTYGGLAKLAGGGPMASQSITTILGKAYDRGETGIPFHRIVYADGRVWMSTEYEKERLKKYKAEGITLDAKGRIIDFYEKIYDPLRDGDR
jgi:methylated-DNA-protein-cysteine methyltransferase-like protein